MEEEEESVDVAGCMQVYLEEGRDAATDRKNETGRWAWHYRHTGDERDAARERNCTRVERPSARQPTYESGQLTPSYDTDVHSQTAFSLCVIASSRPVCAACSWQAFGSATRLRTPTARLIERFFRPMKYTLRIKYTLRAAETLPTPCHCTNHWGERVY